MAEDKKLGVTIEAPAPEEQRPEPPAPEAPGVPTPPGPEVLTVEEQLILEHEGQAALLEMGEAIPDASELPGMTIPDPPAPEPEAQGVIPGMEGPPAPENKVIDLSSVRAGAGQEQTDPAKEGGQEWEKPQEQPESARPSERGGPALSRARAGGADPAQGRLPWGKGGDRLSGPGPAPPVPEPPVRRPGR